MAKPLLWGGGGGGGAGRKSSLVTPRSGSSTCFPSFCPLALPFAGVIPNPAWFLCFFERAEAVEGSSVESYDVVVICFVVVEAVRLESVVVKESPDSVGD